MKVKLGERLKELRLEKGLTQQQLSDELGMNSVTYLRYEKSQREPTLQALMIFADFFQVSTDYLLGYKDY